jgi:hypothetical protein
VTDLLTQLVVWVNAAANALGRWLLAPIGATPEWLSATAVAAATGVLLLVAFKYTSNQRAIQRVRDDVTASLLSLKLFKDSPGATVRAQGRLLLGAGRLFVLALAPAAIMTVPVTLLLVQLAAWYQQRPLAVGEEAVVTLWLQDDADAPLPDVDLTASPAVETTPPGRVRVWSERKVFWNVKARENGYHRLDFRVGDRTVEKELAVGAGPMRVSGRRPGWDWWEALWYPWEEPFGPDSPVRSIEIDYPDRSPWKLFGAEPWVVYWFVVSLIAALCFRRLLNVKF